MLTRRRHGSGTVEDGGGGSGGDDGILPVSYCPLFQFATGRPVAYALVRVHRPRTARPGALGLTGDGSSRTDK